jgi:transcriptional regulator with XRE-family HTH domain
MTRKTRTHLPVGSKGGGGEGAGTEAPQQFMTKEDFARNLYRLMQRKGWSQSELARRADMTRASVSDYINARATPTPHSVLNLARALGVKEHEVMPNHIASAVRDDAVNFEMKVSDGNPNLVRLRMDRLVSLETASKISILLAEDSRVFEHVVNGN